jgi:hypothetical protein
MTTPFRLHHLHRLLLVTNSCSAAVGVPVASFGVKRSVTMFSSSLPAAVSLVPKDLWYDGFVNRNLFLMSALNLLKIMETLPLTLVVTLLMGKWNFSIALPTSLATGFKWKLTFLDGSTRWKNVFAAPTLETKSPCLTSTLS